MKTENRSGLTAEEQAAIRAVNRREEEEGLARDAELRVERERETRRLAEAVYPMPDFGDVKQIDPRDPWADVAPLTADVIRRADPSSIPPAGWLHLRAQTRGLLGGLVQLILSRFSPGTASDIRHRRDRIRNAIDLALLAAAADADELATLHGMYGRDDERAVLHSFGALDTATWRAVVSDLRVHGGVVTLRQLMEKLDNAPSLIERAISGLRRLLAGEPEPEPAPSGKPVTRKSSWESTREAERTAEAAAAKILERGRR